MTYRGPGIKGALAICKAPWLLVIRPFGRVTNPTAVLIAAVAAAIVTAVVVAGADAVVEPKAPAREDANGVEEDNAEAEEAQVFFDLLPEHCGLHGLIDEREGRSVTGISAFGAGACIR